MAKRNNRYLLKVAHSLMFHMNVPMGLWKEAVMTTTYLINRVSSRILGMRSLAELRLGQREFKVPPKVFDCMFCTGSPTSGWQVGSTSIEMYLYNPFIKSKGL